MKTRLLALILCVVFNMNAQSLSLDTTFGNAGKIVEQYNTGRPIEIIFENNQYFIVMSTNTICSKNYNGSINTAFGSNGKVVFNGANQDVTVKGAKFKNGFIYVFGQVADGTSAIYDCFVAKISTTGVLDTTFGVNGRARFNLGADSEVINDILILDSGDLFAIGTRANVIFLSKITATGSQDLTFDATGYKTYPFSANDYSVGVSIYLQGTDLLLVGGTSIFNSVKYFVLLKVNEAGSPISTFGTNGIKLGVLSGASDTSTYQVRSSKLTASNELFFFYYWAWSFNSQGARIGRYNLADDTMLIPHSYMPRFTQYYFVDSNNKVYSTGTESCGSTTTNCERNYKLERKNYDGTADLSFNQTGSYTYSFPSGFLYSDDQASAFYVHDDGKIIMMGQSVNPSSALGDGLAMVRVVDGPLAADDFNNKPKFSLFPNPAGEEINIAGNENNSISEMAVCDIYGKQVLEHRGNISTLSIKNLASGVYFLKVKADDKTAVLKFIKK